MNFRESLQKAFDNVKDETIKQFEKTKSAIERYKPHQLEEKIFAAKKDIEKYDMLISDLEFKEKEYQYKKSYAEKELKLAEEKLEQFNKKDQ
jgi:hypothetical protein